MYHSINIKDETIRADAKKKQQHFFNLYIYIYKYRYMYVIEYQAKLVLEFFYRDAPGRTFLLLSGGGGPGTKTVANNKPAGPLLLWTDRKVGRLVWSEDSYLNGPILSYCFYQIS